MTLERRRFHKEQIYIIKIYLKTKKKVFCEVEVENTTIFDELITEINNVAKNIQVVKFGQVVFNRNDFDYATLEEKIED